MVEVGMWVLNYLVIGIVVQIGLEVLTKWLDSPRLTFKEGMGTILGWPIAVLVFIWFFVKGLLENREK